VDRQYEYVSSGISHHHGFLSYSSGEYVDSVAKKGMILSLRISPAFAEAASRRQGLRNAELEILC